VNDIKIREMVKNIVEMQNKQNQRYHRSKLWWLNSKVADFKSNPYL